MSEYPPPHGQVPYQQPPYHPPPQQPGYPQQPPYGQPPPQSFEGRYAAPPHPPPGGQQQFYPPAAPGQPAPGVYGAPPPHAYNAPTQSYPYPPNPQLSYPPTQPSPGYSPNHTIPEPMLTEISTVRSAMHDKSGKKLMKVLSDLSAVQILALPPKYQAQVFSDLARDIASLTKGDAETYLLFLLQGPLQHDVHYLRMGISDGNVRLLNDVLLGRSNADILAVKAAFQQRHRTSLDAAISSSSLDEKYRRLYGVVLAAARAEDAVPVDPARVSADAKELQEATEGTRFGANEMAVVRVLAGRNDAQLRAIAAAFERDFHKPLDKVLKKEFTGTMEETVLLMLERAVDRARSDARMLEEAMKGFGTDELLLESRCLRVHWDRRYLETVKREFRRLVGKELVERVKKETSGRREDFLVALLD